MGNHLIIAAVQPCNAARRANAGAGGTAECGQTTDPGFLVDGDQIRDQHRPQQFFLRGTDFFCIGNDRQGCRHTLVSAAGDNAHR